MFKFYIFLIAGALFYPTTFGGRQKDGSCESDRIDKLPGVPFEYNFGQFAGFLNASNDQYQHYLHYWLLESQNNSDQDPLVVWFNGGPGASSINSLLWQVGPFHINEDGETLYENVFAWNKVANLLAIDSPAGIGWSYAVDGNIITTDEQVRDDSFRALKDFFEKFPKYKKHELYLAGLSYAGIYIPMLAAKIVTEEAAGNFPTKLTGISIENGWFSHHFYKSSVLHFLYYHGIIGYDKWHKLISTCCPTNKNSEVCDFFSHVQLQSYDSEDYTDGTPCGDLIELNTDTWSDNTYIDTYNIYLDCYEDSSASLQMAAMEKQNKISKLKRFRSLLRKNINEIQNSANDDTARKINYDSTDQWAGFVCWFYAESWMNSDEVKQAMHIKKEQMNQTWSSFTDYTDTHFYKFTQTEMDSYFETIIKNSSTKILIYNGDIDTECDFMMAQKFIAYVAQQNNLQKNMKRQAWNYRGQIAGYREHYQDASGVKKIDLLTVKGAGHFAGYSRPGPALQMFTNFLLNKNNYSEPLPDYISTTLRPLTGS